MGLCASLSDDEKKELQTTKALEQAQIKMKSKENRFVKLLLLGAGESGKSTLFKQMISLYGNGFSEEERRAYIPFIRSNVIVAIQTLCANSDKYGPVSSNLERIKSEIMELKEKAELTPQLAEKIGMLWGDKGIQATFIKRANFQLSDSAPYFLKRAAELSSENYLPSFEDVVHVRVQTKSVIENTFIINDKPFKMFDVGGQRGLRKRWISVFDNVTAVIFVAAISEYDQVIVEDEKTNRVVEALTLFAEIAQSPYFKETPMILFLNKRDLFQEKVKTVKIKPYFADYNGDNSYEDGVKFFTDLFLSKNVGKGKQTYHHVTCATDQDNVKRTFDACKDIILRQTLAASGFGPLE
jgi:GTPase SAR1 family protein